ncbi:MAG: FMN-binding glutamate synthase family protein [Hyphomicrobiaceae bacterium]|nr:FMN-binding glutamate synthase family protein [Hyphomicrobiaceae bacterium]
MNALFAPFEPRYLALTLALLVTAGLAAAVARDATWLPLLAAPLAVSGVLAAIGLRDLFQRRRAILRNYPLIAHMRFIFEAIRPELRQYFFEGDKDGRPFSRDKRAIVYQRAKGALDKRPFGTLYDVYEDGFEWMSHSMAPAAVATEPFRVMVGGPTCTAPYEASVLNISGMSYGALSPNAIRALNKGARAGGFAHTTGEGSISRYHLEHGGDLVWQIASGYFGCRNADGTFCRDRFAENAARPQVRMIEIKLSQGAKPGHGGVLPAAKVNAEIARARGVPVGRDCISPPRHSAFDSPLGLMAFIGELRRLSGGKPVGLKLCVGHPAEVLALAKAMLEGGETPDFIVVDGKEGGTGAAPLEFADHIGMPLRDGLHLMDSTLTGAGLRDRVRLAASGKIVSAFDMARAMALGADWCNAARGFMFAVGCIQAQACHTDKCPTGVTSQDPARWRAVDVTDKSERVARFHGSTVKALAELVAAAGLAHCRDLRPDVFFRRTSHSSYASFADLYPCLETGELLRGARDERVASAWSTARTDCFMG